MSFQEASAFMRKQKLDSFRDWMRWCERGKLPRDIPREPDVAYREFTTWGHFLGYHFLPFQEARAVVHGEGLESKEQFYACYNRPRNIPSNAYKKIYCPKTYRSL